MRVVFDRTIHFTIEGVDYVVAVFPLDGTECAMFVAVSPEGPQEYKPLPVPLRIRESPTLFSLVKDVCRQEGVVLVQLRVT